MHSQNELITDLNVDIDSLKFKGCVVSLWKQHVYLKSYELNNNYMILMDEKLLIVMDKLYMFCLVWYSFLSFF